MDPASSSSSSSSSEDESDSSISVEEISSNNRNYVEENDNENEYDNNDQQPTSWDDLPSEDSCMEDEEEEDIEHLSIADRVNANKNNGFKKRNDGRKKKNEALALAHQRLKQMKKSKQSDTTTTTTTTNTDSNEEEEKKKRKKSKHAPTEASSKRRKRVDVNSSGLGVEIGANRYKPHDPRMESLSGFLDQNVFERRYAFLENLEMDEMKQLKDRIAARSMTGKKGQKKRKKLGLTSSTTTTIQQDKEELVRLQQLHKQRTMGQVQRAAKQAVKKKLRQEVAEGKRGAYYLKRKDQRRLEQEARYEELKKRGGENAVAKALQKKRKKNLSKQTKLMPR